MLAEREDEEVPTKGHDNHIVTIAITSTARLEREEKKIPTIGHATRHHNVCLGLKVLTLLQSCHPKDTASSKIAKRPNKDQNS